MKLLVCTFLVWRPGAHWSSVDINAWFLSHVDPEDGALLGVVLGQVLQNVLESLFSRLATAINLKHYH